MDISARGMGLGSLGPRNARATAWVCCLVAGLGGGSKILGEQLQRSGSFGAAQVAVQISVVAFALSTPLARGTWKSAMCVVALLLGAVGGAVAGIAADQARLADQVLPLLAVLISGAMLRPAGAILVTCATAAAEVAMVSVVLPPEQARSDGACLVLVMILTAAVLIHAGSVQDTLVAKLTRQAAIDPLTGLVTRHVLDEAIRSALVSGVTHAGTALVLIDLDRFKQINDRFGHPVGDEALVHVGAVLQQRSRPADVVARMGGDEIAVLMPGCSYAVALERAQQLVDAVRSTPLVHKGQPLSLSVSVGVSHAPDHALDTHELYVAADRALYAAKHAGRGRVGMLSA